MNIRTKDTGDAYPKPLVIDWPLCYRYVVSIVYHMHNPPEIHPLTVTSRQIV